MTATDEFQVRNIVKTDLDQHFHNKPTFGPIVVHQESDEFWGTMTDANMSEY